VQKRPDAGWILAVTLPAPFMPVTYASVPG
jgi:hypothetical protein